MRRTKFKFGIRLPYWEPCRLKNKKYRHNVFRFLRIEKGEAVIFYSGRSRVSTFTLFVDPNKIQPLSIKRRFNYEKATLIRKNRNND